MAKKKDTSKSAAPERKANTADMVQSEVVALSSITPNKGQIPGVPKNPRSIQDGKFSLLKRSIEEDPEMLDFAKYYFTSTTARTSSSAVTCATVP